MNSNPPVSPREDYYLKRKIIDRLEDDPKEAFLKAIAEICSNEGRGKILLYVESFKLQIVESQIQRKD